ncbi:MAG: ferrous iron transport protein B, partial [Desulfovibrionaceae bacterium]|nr:ferrous iron transport protein B [Desulfovibrionaceae bacterium]
MANEKSCCCCQNSEAKEDGFTAPAATEKDRLRIALAGNPNCGKTTLFNHYTGARQHVGNYPGVTVDRKEGEKNVNGKDVTLVDIPGTYSLTAYSMEEIVARSELSFGMVDAVIDIADASALERNLVLTVQMMEMGMPVVLACNMMDEARKAGIHINMEKLSQKMGVPAMPLVARTGEGAQEILEKALVIAEQGRKEPLRLSYGREIDAALKPLEERLAAEKVLTSQYHPHWTAVKLLEGDSDVIKAFREENAQLCDEIMAECAKTAQLVKDTTRMSCESVITDARYGYIRGLLKDVITQDAGKDRLAFSDALDKVLTNVILGPIIMLAVLYAIFYVSIEYGAIPQGWVEGLFEWLAEMADGALEDGDLKSLIIDGIIGGVGGVMGFVPLIALMFVMIAFIEDSGYMARICYMMDRIFRMFGLHGASVMPYVVAGGIAGGCAIPGAMATRTLRSPKEKLATLLTLPYMPCGAKVPVFLLLIAAFFPEDPTTAFFIVLIAGWICALFVSLLLRHTIIKGESTPFVMELPPYRLPTLFAVLYHMWERSWMYIKKAGTIILAISVVIWFGLAYPELDPEVSGPYEEKIEALTAQKDEAAGQAEELEKQMAAQVEGIQAHVAALAEGNGELGALKAEADKAAAEAAKLEEQLAALPEEDEAAEELSGQVDEAKGKASELEDQVLAKAGEILAAQPDAAVQAEIEGYVAMKAQAAEAKEKAEALEGEAGDLQNELDELALKNSYGGRIGVALEPISKPIGFNWQTNIAIVAGVAAKEAVVSTLGTAYSMGEVDPEAADPLAERLQKDEGFNKATAISLILFVLM